MRETLIIWIFTSFLSQFFKLDSSGLPTEISIGRPTIFVKSVIPSGNKLPSERENEWLIVKSSTNISLECFGLKPVVWNYTNDSPHFQQNFTTLPVTKSRTISYPKVLLSFLSPSVLRALDAYFSVGSNLIIYSSTLNVSISSVEDSRSLTCLELNNSQYDKKNSSSQMDNSQQSFVFIEGDVAEMTKLLLFVYDDKKILVPPTSSEPRQVVQGQRTILPCKASHPSATVQFSNTKGNVLAMKQKFNKSSSSTFGNLTYDFSVGFIVPKVNSFLNGSFRCQGKHGNKSTVLPLTYNYIEEKAPIVNLSRTRPIFLVGEQMVVQCIATFSKKTSLNITWNTPIKNNLFKIKYEEKTKGKNKMVIVSTMNIPNLTVEASGIYNCSVFDQNSVNKLTNSKWIDIKVLEKSFVNLTRKINTRDVHVGSNKSQVVLSVGVVAYPEPNFTWYKNKLQLSNSARLQVRKNNLSIYNPKQDDSGIYTVVAENKDDKGILDFNLTVGVTSKNQIVNPKKIYYRDTRHILSCEYSGIPSPRSWWLWRPCIDFKCFDDVTYEEKKWINPNNSINYLNEVIRNERFVDLTVTAKQTGIFGCFSENSEGWHMSTTKFIIADVPGGLAILTNSSYEVVTGDDVMMSCYANLFLYRSVIWWVRSGDIWLQINEADIKMTRTNYSLVATVIFSSVGFRGKKSYACIGRNKFDDYAEEKTEINFYNVENITAHPEFIGTEDLQFLILSVLPLEVPWFRRALSKKTAVHVGSDIIMTCVADGRPYPIVTWYRNRQPIKDFLMKRTAVSNLNVSKTRKNGSLNFLYEPEGSNSSLILTSVTSTDEGLYECRASNKAGSSSSLTSLYVVNDAAATMTATTVMLLTFLMAIVLISVCIYIFIRKQKNWQTANLEMMLLSTQDSCSRYNPELPLDEQTEVLSYNSEEWEINYSRIKFGLLLGSGAFGQVFKATLDNGAGKFTTVAIKTVKDAGDVYQLKALISELKVLIHLGCHPNLLGVIGAVTKDIRKGYLYVITDYCLHGNLKCYLQKHSRELALEVKKTESMTAYHFHNLTDVKIKHEGTGCEVLKEQTFEPSIFTIGNISSSSEENTQLEIEIDKICQKCQVNNDKKKQLFNRYNPNVEVINNTTNYDLLRVQDHKCIHGNGKGFVSNKGYEDTTKKIHDSCEELTLNDLYNIALQVARGLDYLGSKKYIHRDLAARNVLVDANKIIKICDFGLAKDCYKYVEYHKKSQTPVPVKWMALESLTKNVYTLQSDIWSYGVLIWEIFSLGGNPYAGLEIDKSFISKLEQGLRLEIPTLCDRKLYNLMISCWDEEPERRPTSCQLVESISCLIGDRSKLSYLDLMSSSRSFLNSNGICLPSANAQHIDYFNINDKIHPSYLESSDSKGFHCYQNEACGTHSYGFGSKSWSFKKNPRNSDKTYKFGIESDRSSFLMNENEKGFSCVKSISRTSKTEIETNELHVPANMVVSSELCIKSSPSSSQLFSFTNPLYGGSSEKNITKNCRLESGLSSSETSTCIGENDVFHNDYFVEDKNKLYVNFDVANKPYEIIHLNDNYCCELKEIKAVSKLCSSDLYIFKGKLDGPDKKILKTTTMFQVHSYNDNDNTSELCRKLPKKSVESGVFSLGSKNSFCGKRLKTGKIKQTAEHDVNLDSIDITVHSIKSFNNKVEKSFSSNEQLNSKRFEDIFKARLEPEQRHSSSYLDDLSCNLDYLKMNKI